MASLAQRLVDQALHTCALVDGKDHQCVDSHARSVPGTETLRQTQMSQVVRDRDLGSARMTNSWSVCVSSISAATPRGEPDRGAALDGGLQDERGTALFSQLGAAPQDGPVRDQHDTNSFNRTEPVCQLVA
jgi:hypothetical protein